MRLTTPTADKPFGRPFSSNLGFLRKEPTAGAAISRASQGTRPGPIVSGNIFWQWYAISLDQEESLTDQV